MALPFTAMSLEAILVVTAPFALALPMAVLKGYRRTLPEATVPTAAFSFVASALILFTTMGRVGHAQRMAWEIDGKVQEVVRSSNHQLPSLIVLDRGTLRFFEAVDLEVFRRAAPGKHLKKRAGSPVGLLDDTPVRVVPESSIWP